MTGWLKLALIVARGMKVGMRDRANRKRERGIPALAFTERSRRVRSDPGIGRFQAAEQIASGTAGGTPRSAGRRDRCVRCRTACFAGR